MPPTARQYAYSASKDVCMIRLLWFAVLKCGSCHRTACLRWVCALSYCAARIYMNKTLAVHSRKPDLLPYWTILWMILGMHIDHQNINLPGHGGSNSECQLCATTSPCTNKCIMTLWAPTQLLLLPLILLQWSLKTTDYSTKYKVPMNSRRYDCLANSTRHAIPPATQDGAIHCSRHTCVMQRVAYREEKEELVQLPLGKIVGQVAHCICSESCDVGECACLLAPQRCNPFHHIISDLWSNHASANYHF